MDPFDVIIIGTGAGGGTLLHALAPTGKRILALERGGFLPRERANWDSREVFLRGRYKTKETWLDRDGNELHPGIHYHVGGNTKLYGAALLRFRAEDFGELRHEDGVSPAWPISYDDLEPWYGRAERLYHVHGARGQDPTEPWASAPYPHPPVANEPRVQQLFDDLSRLGRRPFPLPLGVLLDEAHPRRSQCIRCDTCDGFPCPVNAKADAQVICVEPALEHPNVTLLTGALVTRLETSGSGRSVAKVHVLRGGAAEEYRGDIVVVACGAINSAALLLRSASDRHPHGLANGSGVVGRFYMCHNNSAMIALSTRKNPTVFQKTIGLNDFYFRDPDGGYDLPMGHIQLLGKSDADMLRGDAPPGAPTAVLAEMAERSVDFWMTTEDLPDAENRVTVDAEGRITLHYQENNAGPHARLKAKLKSMLSAIGCENELLPCNVYLGKKIPLAGTAHQCGTVRFGRDRATSALDPDCKAHELDNLYVVDGSFFVSSTSVNPALTIMANALRVGEHLRQRLG